MCKAPNTLTAVKALKEMIALWTKLAENPQLDKYWAIREFSELRHQEKYKAYCSLCEYTLHQENKLKHRCQYCLIWDKEFGCIHSFASPYAKWFNEPVGDQSRADRAAEMVAIAKETLDFLLSLGYEDRDCEIHN